MKIRTKTGVIRLLGPVRYYFMHEPKEKQNDRFPGEDVQPFLPCFGSEESCPHCVSKSARFEHGYVAAEWVGKTWTEWRPAIFPVNEYQFNAFEIAERNVPIYYAGNCFGTAFGPHRLDYDKSGPVFFDVHAALMKIWFPSGVIPDDFSPSNLDRGLYSEEQVKSRFSITTALNRLGVTSVKELSSILEPAGIHVFTSEQFAALRGIR